MQTRMIFPLIRCFSEVNPFKDSDGRFKTRWNEKENPTVSILHENEIPAIKIKLDVKVDKSRVFDFELPNSFKKFEPPFSIWSVSDTMFSVNQVWLPGPILIFPEAVFQWHASTIDDIEDHHLEIIKIVEPRIEYAIIGTGKQKTFNYSEGLRQRFRMIGINIDFCPTVIII